VWFQIGGSDFGANQGVSVVILAAGIGLLATLAARSPRARAA